MDRRVPSATYRLQLRREFTFDDAAAIVPYLADLGVSHVYCSPVLQAVPGSAHGYDVVDHTRFSDDLGGEAAWRRFVDACHAARLGIVVDVVPNHMAVPTPESLNRPLWEVLRKGRGSSYADWFDIDWDAGGGKVLMPVLGKPVEECLRDGEITVETDAGIVHYFDHEVPLAPGTSDLDSQHYRLAFWRVGNTDLNYRRFFDVTSLIGVRVEVPEVFDASHDLLLRAVRTGDIDGLRVDHPDGLADPGGYLERLRVASGGVWTVVEKILEGREVLPREWACDGTTGYDALAAVTGILVDRDGEKPVTAAYERITGQTESYEEVVRDGKSFAVERLLPAEVDRLLRDLEPVRSAERAGAELSTPALRRAIVELLVDFDVYRAYAGDPDSRVHVDEALEHARRALPEDEREVAWLGSVLRGEVQDAAAAAFVTRFEQTTGPAMAKGVEDTAFYRYFRLVALNEVGGDPGEFGRDVNEFHDYCRRVLRDWPATMTTLSTHDTKRSEDVRARLLVLAELPDEWDAAVARWRERASGVDANTEYLLWQTLVGVHSPPTAPIDADRLHAYLLKAAKEGKQHTSWTDPDEQWEASLRDLVDRIFGDPDLIGDVEQWVAQHLDGPGRSNALAQKLVQLTMPGVPDIYQGQELPDFSLVDPDNRRPVDYEARRRAVADVAGADPKLRVTAAAVRWRHDHPDTFLTGGYEPVAVVGDAREHAVAFRRGDDVLTVVTRLPVGLARRGGWGDAALDLPRGSWRDVVGNRAVDSPRLAEILRDLPVALLVRDDGGVG